MAQEYLSPAAKEVVQPGMTPCEQAQALNQKELSSDAVKSMSHGLPEKDSVKWATASAEKVSNPAHQADTQAIQAAKAWTQNPNPDTQNAAAAAAAMTDHKTPGAWAAQGAAWSGTGLTPHAVTGAVMLAAAQGGKPIPPPGAAAPALAVPGVPAVPMVAQPKKPLFRLPFLKKPQPELPQVPEVAAPGPDGLTLTPSQRTEMAKNCDPYLKLGCDIGNGKA